GTRSAPWPPPPDHDLTRPNEQKGPHPPARQGETKGHNRRPPALQHARTQKPAPGTLINTTPRGPDHDRERSGLTVSAARATVGALRVRTAESVRASERFRCISGVCVRVRHLGKQASVREMITACATLRPAQTR